MHGLIIHNSGESVCRSCAQVAILNFKVQTWAWAAILNSGVPTALNLRFGRRSEIMRMISSCWKISKSGATAARAHALTFYAPPRDSIAIPASLMRGDIVFLCDVRRTFCSNALSTFWQRFYPPAPCAGIAIESCVRVCE